MLYILLSIATVIPSVQAAAPTTSASSLAFVHSSVNNHRRLLPQSKYLTPFIQSNQPKYHDELHATNNGNDIPLQTSNAIERLELTQQFERWKFFQNLLEGELSPSDVEDVLLLALTAYLQHGPTAFSADNKNENGGNASPVLTEEQRSLMSNLVCGLVDVSDGVGDSRILHMLVLPPVDYESMVAANQSFDSDNTDDSEVEVDPSALRILDLIEQLLPDAIEDEEAFKSAWDVVIDLYGRESVRVREEALQREKEGAMINVDFDGGAKKCCGENLQWRTLCAVGRVLIHYDFLTKGVLDEDTFGQKTA